jgi:predicted secreted protein
MKQQTATDWLFEQLEQRGDAWENVSIRRMQMSIDVSDYLELKRQAREVVRQQIEDAYNQGYRDGEATDSLCKHLADVSEFADSSIYFTQTYEQ